MTRPILVRGELSNWVHVGRVASAVGLVVGLGIVLAAALWGWAAAPWGWAAALWGWLVAGGGAAAWLALEMLAWRARRARTWLTLHPDGMEVEDRTGQRAIHDSLVEAVALETKKNLTNGELSSVTRKVVLWIENEAEPVRLENKIKTGRTDPLAGLIERLLSRLSQRLANELARGGTASGAGWHLSRTAITLGQPPNDEQIPLSDVTAVEACDGQMCLWRSSSDVAAAKLPLAGRNVPLLPALVRPFLSPERSLRQPRRDSAGLGRVLFERRPHSSTLLAVNIAGAMLTITGLALLAAFRGQKMGDEGLLAVSLVLLGAGPLLGLIGWWLAGNAFRCHERGIWKRTRQGQQTMRYEDVARFQYSAVRHYHNGAYVGTQLTMRFCSASPERGAPLKFSTRTRGDDDDLERLRDELSQQIAARMLAQVRAGQPVAWTSNLEFLAEGIRYRPGGIFGRKPAQLLPYAEYGGHELKAGSFFLFSRGHKKPVVSEQAGADNFYPGLCLLQTLESEAIEPQLAAHSS